MTPVRRLRNALPSILHPLRGMRFGTQLFLAFLALVAIPVLAFYGASTAISRDAMVELYSKNTYELLTKNSALFDRRLSDALTSAEKLVYDRELYSVLATVGEGTGYRLASYNARFAAVFPKYFNLRDPDLYSVSVAAPYYSNGTRWMDSAAFLCSDAYRRALAADGGTVWTAWPAEPYRETADTRQNAGDPSQVAGATGEDAARASAGSQAADPDARPTADLLFGAKSSEGFFAFSRVLDCFYVDNATNIRYVFPEDRVKPVATVVFRDSLFRRELSGSIPIAGTMYYVVGPDRQVVASNDPSAVVTIGSDGWYERMCAEPDGVMRATLGGSEVVVCHATSSLTGWRTVVMMRTDRLTADTTRSLGRTALLLMAVILGMAVLTSLLLSRRIAKPMKRLTEALRKTGEGDFGTQIPESGSVEFRRLIGRFNGMSSRIERLIRENYEGRIHQKEAEIQLLNRQLNPHFLYNTLNLINCIAIEDNSREISKLLVALSNMLHYTADTRRDMGKLDEELQWLRDYVTIMSARREGEVIFTTDIDPALHAHDIPRLMLQPFVENAFIHGFADRVGDCRLSIVARFEGGGQAESGITDCEQSDGGLRSGGRVYIVEDDGAGIPPERLEQIRTGGTGSIGVSNVDARIRLMYGEEYGVSIESMVGEWTRVTVRLPGSSA